MGRLLGNLRRRRDAVMRCFLLAARRGYRAFGVQDGGECFSGPLAHRTFRRYGRSNRCKNGRGGPWANDVYIIMRRSKYNCESGVWNGQVAWIHLTLFYESKYGCPGVDLFVLTMYFHHHLTCNRRFILFYNIDRTLRALWLVKTHVLSEYFFFRKSVFYCFAHVKSIS